MHKSSLGVLENTCIWLQSKTVDMCKYIWFTRSIEAEEMVVSALLLDML